MSRGQPKKFNEESLIQLFRDFCNYIRETGFSTIPSQTAFCRWLGDNNTPVDRRTIYNSLNEYFPKVKAEYETLRSDLIAEGAMLGKYNSTMSIFVLKNWSNWRERAEIEQDITAKGIEVTINVVD